MEETGRNLKFILYPLKPSKLVMNSPSLASELVSEILMGPSLNFFVCLVINTLLLLPQSKKSEQFSRMELVRSEV